MMTQEQLIKNQYNRIGTADDMELYERVTYCGSTRGSKSWAVKFADGRICSFSDYPSIKRLRERQYPVTTDRNTWKREEI
jgi:hypothetical protein